MLQEDTISSLERNRRSSGCTVHTETTLSENELLKIKDIDTPPSVPPFDIHKTIPDVHSNVKGFDISKSIGGLDTPYIPPISQHDRGFGGGLYIPKAPPNLANDYAVNGKTEHGEETENSYGSSTSMRRQESYDHQEFSHTRSRKLPGWRTGWGGEAEDPKWKTDFETSANDINEVNGCGRQVATSVVVPVLLLVILF